MIDLISHKGSVLPAQLQLCKEQVITANSQKCQAGTLYLHVAGREDA